MNKKVTISTLVLLVFTVIGTSAYCSEKIPDFSQNPKPDRYEMPNHHKFQPPSPEKMAAKKAEFEKRLELSDEQKKQIEENRLKDREKIKPIMDALRIKRNMLKKIENDIDISKSDKEKQIKKLRQEIMELNIQLKNMFEQNMKNFESILNDKQKQEFKKIRKEQKKEMEKRHKEFEQYKKMKNKK